ncbi:MAG: thymidine phosphorylase [Lentisphaerae bacterium]|nr:thymidine phosphorylase [Lentisphaerota bacterium]
MLPQWLIEKKRDGQALDAEEIRFLVEGYAAGTIPDYQMAAFAMAVFFRGMDFHEVSILTRAMMDSGEVLDTSSIPLPKVDKHSTGGIGDKVSLVLAPLAASCGLAIPMISGRGLGITGGTLDKLESIPGYRTDLAPDEFLSVLCRCGCSIVGQTQQLAPADKKLYALRDVTGTVPSIPLISASIMSKKMAEGLDALVLDVKWGKGAFMKTIEQARELARTMVEIGTRMGKGMAAVLTNMDQPLGEAAGNAVEVAESVLTLKGEGPPDHVAVTLELATHMLLLAGKAGNRSDAMSLLESKLKDGSALDTFREMVRLQGGDPAVIDDLSLLPAADIRWVHRSSAGGFVQGVDAEKIGRACVVLGAGRTRVDEGVDHAVGITGLVKIGTPVANGHPFMTLHANDEQRLEQARAIVEDAVELADAPPDPVSLIAETILPRGSEK